MNESLTDFIIKSHDGGIYTVSRFISRQIASRWQRVAEENFAHVSRSSGLIDDTLYILYLKLLFEPAQAALERAGFAADPPLPGSFSNSREWGPEQERQRWLWSRLCSPRGELLGTMLIIFYHDHTQLKIPRAPLVLPIEEEVRRSEVEEAGIELSVALG